MLENVFEAIGKLASGAENKVMEKLNSSPLTINVKKCSMFIYTNIQKIRAGMIFFFMKSFILTKAFIWYKIQ